MLHEKSGGVTALQVPDTLLEATGSSHGFRSSCPPQMELVHPACIAGAFPHPAVGVESLVNQQEKILISYHSKMCFYTRLQGNDVL